MTVALEDIVRPFVVVDSRPPQPVAPLPVSDLGALAEASIAWGDTAEFVDPGPGIITSENQNDGVTRIIIPAQIPGSDILRDFEDEIEEAEEDDSEEVQPPVEYREIARTVVVVRVTNPQDAQQYVDVEDATDITFRGPEGRDIKLIFRTGGG